jgi:hypothetical protein
MERSAKEPDMISVRNFQVNQLTRADTPSGFTAIFLLAAVGFAMAALLLSFGFDAEIVAALASG